MSVIEVALKTVCIMIGLPGSGKSTHVNWMLVNTKGLQVVCRDDIRKALGVEFEIELEPKVGEVVELQTIAAMKRGLNIIVDECHTTIKSVSEICDLADKYGYRVVGILLNTSYGVCVKRRVKFGFPKAVIDRMHKQLLENLGGIVELIDELRVVGDSES